MPGLKKHSPGCNCCVIEPEYVYHWVEGISSPYSWYWKKFVAPGDTSGSAPQETISQPGPEEDQRPEPLATSQRYNWLLEGPYSRSGGDGNNDGIGRAHVWEYVGGDFSLTGNVDFTDRASNNFMQIEAYTPDWLLMVNNINFAYCTILQQSGGTPGIVIDQAIISRTGNGQTADQIYGTAPNEHGGFAKSIFAPHQWAFHASDIKHGPGGFGAPFTAVDLWTGWITPVNGAWDLSTNEFTMNFTNTDSAITTHLQVGADDQTGYYVYNAQCPQDPNRQYAHKLPWGTMAPTAHPRATYVSNQVLHTDQRGDCVAITYTPGESRTIWRFVDRQGTAGFQYQLALNYEWTPGVLPQFWQTQNWIFCYNFRFSHITDPGWSYVGPDELFWRIHKQTGEVQVGDYAWAASGGQRGTDNLGAVFPIQLDGY